MTGSGVGATYDQNREVLWILAKAKIDVAPDKDGQGGLEAVTATAIGLARAEHYIRARRRRADRTGKAASSRPTTSRSA